MIQRSHIFLIFLFHFGNSFLLFYKNFDFSRSRFKTWDFQRRPLYDQSAVSTDNTESNSTETEVGRTTSSDIIFSNELDLYRSKRAWLRNKQTSFLSTNSRFASGGSRSNRGVVNDKRTKGPQLNGSNQGGGSSTFNTFGDFSSHPPQASLLLDYDFLSANSMHTIEILPHYRKNKGDWYLVKWWKAAKKWGLLNGELQADLEKKLKIEEDQNKAQIGSEQVDATSSTQYTDIASNVDSNSSFVDTSDKDPSECPPEVRDVPYTNADLGAGAGSFGSITDSDSASDSGYSSNSSDTESILTQENAGFDSYFNSLRSTGVPSNDSSINSNTKSYVNSGSNSNSNSNRNTYRDSYSNSSSRRDNSNYSRSRNSNRDDLDMDVPLGLLQKICRAHRARVIVVGDVHGCVDELCDLLREVKYLPGDLVLLLGDLVAKGPNSKAVIRLAMDIEAISVRGNHDQEVVRQGISFSRRTGKYESKTARRYAEENLEHLRIAMSLSMQEFEWLSSLPYYIKAADLGCLFVHAGFQKNVPLPQQEPWSMMTMRSLLPTGKVSPRCIQNHPWGREWGGPLKVYFGHDAARGLQSYASAMGLDTGCVYGGNLSCILLPDEDLVSTPARQVYQTYGKADSHKVYALTDVNATHSAMVADATGTTTTTVPPHARTSGRAAVRAAQKVSIKTTNDSRTKT